MRKACLALIPVVIFADPIAAAPDHGWAYYGGDQGGRHYSQATQINTDNVAELDVAWVYRSGDVATYADEM